MADYSELKRKAQEIRDEVKAGANTASRVGIAIEETVNALEAENVRAVAKEGSLQNDIQSINERIQDLGDIREGVGELQEDVTEQAEELNSLLTILEGKLDIKDLGSGLRPDQAVSEIISYVRSNNIKSALVFKYIDTDNSSTFGICISRIGVSGWILYLVARKGIEVLKYNSYGSRETWNEYGGVLRHDMNSVANEQLECLSIKGLKSVLTTKQDALAPGDGITLADNVVSTLIGDGLAYNGREMVVSHDATLKTTGGKLGVNAGKGLYVNPDNKFGVHTGKGLAINHDDGTVEVAEEVFDEIETKAPKVGYAPDLKVSYAEELVGRGESTPEVIGAIRPTSGEESSIKDGNATIERIKGESVVWNQLVKDGYTLSKEVYIVGGHITLNYIQDIVSDGYINLIQLSKIQGYENKKCLVTVSHPKFRIGNGWTSGGNSNGYKYNYKFLPQTSIISLGLYPDADLEFGTYEFDIALYDLTLMFGAGNEPTTIEEFEARKPLGVTNEYNEGTIVSFQGGDVKSVGFNALDCEREAINDTKREPTTMRVWEYDKAYYPATNNGHVIPTYSVENIIITPNLIQAKCSNVWYGLALPLQLVAGAEYEYQVSSSQGQPSIMYLDKDGKFDSCIYITKGARFTAEANKQAVYVLQPTVNGQTISVNNPCFHLVHSGYRNGEYEPYVDDIHPLPDIKKIKDSNGDTLFPYGLLSAGSVHDEITATKAIKRIGVVDMGSLKWNVYNNATYNKHYFYSNQFGNAKGGALVNSIYSYDGPATLEVNINNKTCLSSTANGICIVYDDGYTSATDFKSAMQGVFLYYELAEPIEVDLPEPLNMTYEAWDFGTEELLAKGATTPLNADIVYLFNAVDRIRENSRHVEESEAKLTSMEQRIAQLETMIASLTNTANDE